MSNYFQSFPIVNYKFGDETEYSLFQNISAYVDVLDTTKNAQSFYSLQPIHDFDRPDTLSYKLYDTINYHWTFFYLNDKLRLQGWPLASSQIFDVASTNWPHQTITTSSDITTTFRVGQQVTGSTSGAVGVVQARNLDLGQIVIQSDGVFVQGEIIQYQDETTGLFKSVEATKSVVQYLSVHHYENLDGTWQDIDPYNPVTNNLIAKTYVDVLQEQNDDLKMIKVLRPDAINGVVGQWQSYMKGRI